MIEAPASKVSLAMVTVAIRPPTTAFFSNILMVPNGDGSGEYFRRKWTSDEPEIPLPTTHTVAGAGGEEEREGGEKESKRRESRPGSTNGGVIVESRYGVVRVSFGIISLISLLVVLQMYHMITMAQGEDWAHSIVSGSIGTIQ